MFESKYNMLTVFILLLTCFSTNGSSVGSPNMIEYFATLTASEIARIPKSILEDSIMETGKIIDKYGYPVEYHEVQTDDGYLLTTHRIPRGKNDNSERKRTPVFLMHGILCSSAIWVFNGPEKSLAFMLADAGYDVWLGNARGNFYGRKHISINPAEPKFWKFSWHEIGYYDHPSTIDYILNKTESEKLHFLGYSQGATTFFVMASERPEYNEKIISMHALGPVVYLTNAKSPLVKYLAPYGLMLDIISFLIGIDEFLPSSEFNTIVGHLFCGKKSLFLPVCTNTMFLISGGDEIQFNSTLLPVYMSHTPAGSSSRQIVHFAQLYNAGKFRKFDYTSKLVNLYTYGSIEPPDYNLKRITTPVTIHYSENDWLLDLNDLDRLYNELGNPVAKIKIPLPEFGHFDFMWAIDAPKLLYNVIIDLLDKS